MGAGLVAFVVSCEVQGPGVLKRVGVRPVRPAEGDGVLRVDDGVLSGVRDEFARAGEGFADLVQPIASVPVDLLTGCGQVADAARAGAQEFGLSWAGALTVLSDGAGLVAGNVGAFEVDLARVDDGSSLHIKF